jgi:hypothetical protein
MGRLVPHGDPNHREFLLIELKRPSLTIGRKELDQLEDYVTTILAQPDFINTSTTWNFYIVTSEYDDVIKQRITQDSQTMPMRDFVTNFLKETYPPAIGAIEAALAKL